jgi:hypothetical protein
MKEAARITENGEWGEKFNKELNDQKENADNTESAGKWALHRYGRGTMSRVRWWTILVFGILV